MRINDIHPRMLGALCVAPKSLSLATKRTTQEVATLKIDSPKPYFLDVTIMDIKGPKFGKMGKCIVNT